MMGEGLPMNDKPTMTEGFQRIAVIIAESARRRRVKLTRKHDRR